LPPAGTVAEVADLPAGECVDEDCPAPEQAAVNNAAETSRIRVRRSLIFRTIVRTGGSTLWDAPGLS
jgi:hypothetical protein